MNTAVDRDKFVYQLTAFEPRKYVATRILALYSAAISMADDRIMTRTIEIGKRHDINRMMFYEIVLQSYLFLGFPRMLQAAENLEKMFPCEKNYLVLEKISEAESHQWYDDGL